MTHPCVKLIFSVVQTGRGGLSRFVSLCCSASVKLLQAYCARVQLDTFPKLLARLEMGYMFARNSHLFACIRVPAGARRLVVQRKRAKATEFDTLSCL